jgi:hypothetical protein
MSEGCLAGADWRQTKRVDPAFARRPFHTLVDTGREGGALSGRIGHRKIAIRRRRGKPALPPARVASSTGGAGAAAPPWRAKPPLRQPTDAKRVGVWHPIADGARAASNFSRDSE